MVIGNVPSGVLDNVEMVKLTDTGVVLVGDTELDGCNWQAAPAGKFEHERAMEPLKLPAAETENETAGLVLPGVTLTLAGEGAPKEKSTMCRVNGKSLVTVAASVPCA